MPSLVPVPNTPLRDEPQQDAIWKRWLRELQTQVNTNTNSSFISVSGGGTGISSYTVGDMLYANTTSSLAKLADVATGYAIISGGVGAVPVYGKIGLTTHVDGILPIVNGGTGVSTATAVGAAYEIARTNSSATAAEYTGWPTTRNATTSSETLTIGSGQAYLTASPFANLGTISNSGTMLVL